jgi:MFS family permease
MTLIFITPPYLLGIFLWGRIGDNLVVKHPRIRVLLINLSFIITIPLFMVIFWIRGSPSPSTDSLGAALTNPGILLFITLFAVGIFLMAMYDPNQPPILNAINLPETRGSVFALNRFVEEVGGALGPLIVGILFEAVGQDFSIAMTLGMLCMIPGMVCWIVALKTYLHDRNLIQNILTERAQEALGKNS